MLQTKQRWLLGIIQRYIHNHGYPPSIKGLAETMGTSDLVIDTWLLALEAEGYLKYERGKARGIRLVERVG